MRILPSDEHQSRKEKILQSVVHLYIKTGKPVGSSTILENFDLNLSPATIRNVLAELEKENFLTHPHTSAGRMPTDKGYRFYVDSIVHIQRLAQEEEARIKDAYMKRMREIEDLMSSTTKILSSLSHCTGFALPQPRHEEKLRRVELIPINATQILGVLVSETGVVQNRMVAVHSVPNDETLRAASRFLTERLSGLTFSEAEAKFFIELHRYEDQQRMQTEFLEDLSRHLFENNAQRELYVEGASNILKFPEFQDYETMRAFAHIFDEKKLLSQVLSQELGKRGLQVKIGLETSPELKNFSVVSSTYHMRGRPMGVIGILGPKRMEYQRMMAIVNSVASLINQFLDGQEPPQLEGKE